jgi:hypothetical protein
MEVSSSTVKVVSQPRAETPEIQSDVCVFQCLGLKLQGSAAIGSSASALKPKPVLPPQKYPVGMGWRIGWVQVNTQEWRWALYRTAGSEDAILQESPSYGVLDTEDDAGRDIFTRLDNPAYQVLSSPAPGNVEFIDFPVDKFLVKLGAAEGNRILSAIGIRLSFVCALAARAPDDALYVLQWVPWYVQWSYDFLAAPSGLTPTRLPVGCKAQAGPVRSGCPQVLSDAIQGPRGRSANVMTRLPPRSTRLSGPQLQARLQVLRARG